MKKLKDMLSLSDMLTHGTLGAIMPFCTGWLDDGSGKPCEASVAISNFVYLTQFEVTKAAPRVYTN